MALENFVEMRDTVGDPKFLLMKAVQNLLENEFEDDFRSRCVCTHVRNMDVAIIYIDGW